MCDFTDDFIAKFYIHSCIKSSTKKIWLLLSPAIGTYKVKNGIRWLVFFCWWKVKVDDGDGDGDGDDDNGDDDRWRLWLFEKRVVLMISVTFHTQTIVGWLNSQLLDVWKKDHFNGVEVCQYLHHWLWEARMLISSSSLCYLLMILCLLCIDVFL